MPSYVVRVSFAQTPLSGASSASRWLLRSAAAAAFSQSDLDHSSSEEASRNAPASSVMGPA